MVMGYTLLLWLTKNKKELFVSAVLGLVGLCVNFFPIKLFLFNGVLISISPGLILPLFAALAFGLKFGLISGILAVTPLWFVWYAHGYGIFYMVPVLLVWIAWHGYGSDLRRRHPTGCWYHDMFISEVAFRTVSSVGFIYLFPLLAAQNPPLWDASSVYRDIGDQVLALKVVVQTVFSFVMLTVCDALLHIRSLRNALDLPECKNRLHWVFPIGIFIGFVLVMVDMFAFLTYVCNTTGLHKGLYIFSFEHILGRLMTIALCVFTSIIVYTALNRQMQQKRMLTSTSAAVERKNAQLIASQKELSKSQSMMKTYVDKAPYGIFITDDEGGLIDCNDQAFKMSGYTRNDFDRMSMTGLVLPADCSQMKERLADMIDQRLGFVISMQTKIITKKGMIRDWALKITRMSAQRLLIYAEDITDKEVYRRRLEYVNKYDTLSGMYNKNYLTLYMEQALHNRTNLPISIIYTDINGLRRVNEENGYGAGDDVICALGSALEQFFDGKGTVFRVGGDSFAIVLAVTTYKKCCKLLGKAQKALQNVGGRGAMVSTAMGCATIDKSGMVWQDILRLAESRMYASKIIQDDSLRSNVMRSFMKALSERSNETEEHVQRMKNTAERIAETMGLGRDEVDNVVMATQFHDIGKMGIPDSILFKKGKLTDEEWTVMQKHCEIGHRIVSAAADMSVVAEYVLAHHERWDGSGYPNGRKGKDIPMASRIIAVADAFDAMTNERVYKHKVATDEAVEEIKRCSGSQFDPAVVDAFLEVMEMEAVS